MQFYNIWRENREKETSWLVSADGTEEAKAILCSWLNLTLNVHEPRMFRIGYATEPETNWRTVKKNSPSGWGGYNMTTLTAWQEWLECKSLNIKKVILEYTP